VASIPVALERLRSNTLISGALIYAASNILNALIPFLLLPVLTRYLSPVEYGRIAIFQTLVVGLGAFVGLSVAAAASRKYFDLRLNQEALAKYIAACIQILVVSGLLVAGVAWWQRSQLSEWLGLEGVWIACAILLSAFNCVIGLRLGQWQIRQRALPYGLLQVSFALLNALGSLFLVVAMRWGAEGRIAAQVAAAMVFSLLAMVMLRRDGLLRLFCWDPQYVKEALSFGVPLVPHVAGAIVLTTVDRFFVQSKLGLAELGIYMVAIQLASGLGLLFDAVNNAYAPWLLDRLGRQSPSEARQIVRNTYIWFAFILVLAAALFQLGPPVVALVAGQQYASAGELLGWLGLGQVFGGMYLMVANYIFHAKSTWLLSVATLSSGAVNIGLLMILIDQFGLAGAAISFAVAMGARFVLTWWVAHKRHPMPWLSFLNRYSHA
jgi:O-antigen/teichoic acid export membrane protein